jgi:hypothetical protein
VSTTANLPTRSLRSAVHAAGSEFSDTALLATSCRAQLAQHRPSFTKLSPFNAGIELHADGRVGISSSTDNVTNISSCAAAIHGTFHGSVQYWPCVSVGPGAADPLMPKLFADPSAFIADAIALSKQLNIA